MIVIFKNEDGLYSVRPAFIGFIKNDVIRRALGILFYPLIIIVTIIINLIQALFVSLVVIVRAVYYPLVNITSYRNSEIWKRPRTKADNHNKMD